MVSQGLTKDTDKIHAFINLWKFPLSPWGSSNLFTTDSPQQVNISMYSCYAWSGHVEYLELILSLQILSAQDEMGEITTGQDTGLK